MWSEFVGKRVKVVQSDDWVKHGILEKFNEGFVFLRFNDGRLVAIANSDIKKLDEMGKE